MVLFFLCNANEKIAKLTIAKQWNKGSKKLLFLSLHVYLVTYDTLVSKATSLVVQQMMFSAENKKICARVALTELEDKYSLR